MALWYPGAQPARSPGVWSEPATSTHRFRAWTEGSYVTGTLVTRHRHDRLSDILNRREPMTVVDSYVWPLGAPRAVETKRHAVLDPFDFDMVLGDPPELEDPGVRAARRIHKVRYPVIVTGMGFEVRGTLHLFPGNAPEVATYHTGVLFVPVTNHVVRLHGRVVSGPDSDVVLVNRHAIREIRQLDTRN
jgi:hypothetical protein